MKEITYRDETGGNIEICRELCDSLMQYQASKAESALYRGILGSMCFENRLLPSFTAALEKQLIVAYDGDKPVGYVFSTAETVTAKSRDMRPAWALKIPDDTDWLYPDWLTPPVKIGDLNNLYVLWEYRSLGIGKELTERAMSWLRAVSNAEWLFVYVANGNNIAPFYQKYGFQFSHRVLGGLIDAYYQRNIVQTTVKKPLL